MIVPPSSALVRPVKFKPFGPRIKQFAFRLPQNDAKINILVGSVRSSKTWGTFPKIAIGCKYPVAGRKILTGVSKQNVYQNVLTDLFELVGTKNYSCNRASGELRLFNTDWLVIGARDEGSEKIIRGATVGFAVCDELVKMPKSFFDMLLSRMSPDGARLYATTNPDNPSHWVKRDLLGNSKYRFGLGKDIWYDTYSFQDNPNISDDYKEWMERSYAGIWYKRFILGQWVAGSGSIYGDVLAESVFYDTHEVPPGLRKRNGHLEHWVAVDYGTVNPCVFVDVFDTGQTVYWDREYYWNSRSENRQKTDAEYAEDLLEFIGAKRGPLNPNPFEIGSNPPLEPRELPGIIVDPSAASFKAELVKRGLYVIDADNAVGDGLRRVSIMLQRGLLRVNRRCTEGRRELEGYAWNPRSVALGVDEPLKQDDHFPDAGRYFVETRISDWRIAA